MHDRTQRRRARREREALAKAQRAAVKAQRAAERKREAARKKAEAEEARAAWRKAMLRPEELSSVPWDRHPSLEEAHSLVDKGLRWHHICEMKGFVHPPVVCAKLARAVLFMFGYVGKEFLNEVDMEQEWQRFKGWQEFRRFVANRQLYYFMMLYDPTRVLKLPQILLLHKYLEPLSLQRVGKIDTLSYYLLLWMRAVINHWHWCSGAYLRAWARVLAADHTGTEVTILGIPGVAPETRVLLQWFQEFPGCCKVVGGMMLRYACDPVRSG